MLACFITPYKHVFKHKRGECKEADPSASLELEQLPSISNNTDNNAYLQLKNALFNGAGNDEAHDGDGLVLTKSMDAVLSLSLRVHVVSCIWVRPGLARLHNLTAHNDATRCRCNACSDAVRCNAMRCSKL